MALTAEDLFDDFWRTSPARMAEYLTRGEFQRFRHINLLDQVLVSGIARGGARIIVSMPPRHGKSWLSSFYAPAWFLSLWPDRNVILTSYESTFAASWGRRVRNLLQEHGKVLGVRLADDSTAADRFHTTEGGGMMTAGAGGAITGKGASLVIVDDYQKGAEDAFSSTQRAKIHEWFSSVVLTRLEPGASIVVIATRWHEDDLIGRLLREQSGWTEIRLPALAEENDPIGRKPGEALCPERYDEGALLEIKSRVGSRVWDALYQQRPSSEEGNIFKREWWKFYHKLPERFDEIIQSWDLAFKDTKTSDFVVGQVWGKVGADKYLIDQVRERMDFPTTLRAVRALSSRHPRAFRKLIEDKANGPAVIAALKHEISGLIPIEPDGGKEARASAVSPEIEAGNVYLPDPAMASWVQPFVDECANFPNGSHDDVVDAMSQALIRLRGGRKIVGIPISGHGSGVIFQYDGEPRTRVWKINSF